MNTEDNGDLPEGWACSPLREVGSRRLGKMLDAAKQGTGKRFPYLRNINVRWGEFDLSNLLSMAFSHDELTEFELRPGDVLICEGGEPGRAAVWTQEGSEIKFQKALHRVRLLGGIDPRWLVYHLQHDASAGSLEEHFTGSTIKHFTGVSIAQYPLRLPPLAELRRVVAAVESVLAKVNAARERLNRVPAILKRFRQAVLSAACSGRLTADWREKNDAAELASVALARLERARRERWEQAENARLRAKGKVPSDDTWKQRYRPGCPAKPDADLELPEGWQWATVSQIARLDVGFAFKSSEFTDKGIRLLRGENVEPGALRWLDVRHWPENKLDGLEHLLIELGEIILALDRPIISTGLKIARAQPHDLPCVLVQRMMRFKMLEPSLTEYLYLCLQTPSFLTSLHDSTTGSDLPHITGTGVAEFTFPFPPLAEQQEIVRRVGELFALADVIEARLTDARQMADQLTQAVLAKAFRGELVPTEAELARREKRTYEPAADLLARIRAERDQPPAPANGKLTRTRKPRTTT